MFHAALSHQPPLLWSPGNTTGSLSNVFILCYQACRLQLISRCSSIRAATSGLSSICSAPVSLDPQTWTIKRSAVVPGWAWRDASDNTRDEIGSESGLVLKMKTFLNPTSFLGAYRVFKVHHRPSNLRWVQRVRTSGDAAWTNTDPCDASFSVTLNSSTSTTCSGKRICRLLRGGGELSLSSAGAAVLTSPCDRSAFLQRALPGSGCSPNRYPRAHRAHAPSCLRFILLRQLLSPPLRWPPRCPGVPLPRVSHLPRRLLCEVKHTFWGFLLPVRSEPSRFCPFQRSAGVPAADGHSQAEKRVFPGALWSLDFHVKGDVFARFYMFLHLLEE